MLYNTHSKNEFPLYLQLREVASFLDFKILKGNYNMKRTIKLAVAAALAMGATSAFATNGDNLIGLGAKSRGMAGIGIGMSHGAESGLSNPALIKGDEVTFGGTIFMPDVKFNNAMTYPTQTGMVTAGTKQADSASDLSVIPEVAVSMEVNDNFTWGIGMYGVAGMGVDYRDDVANYDANGNYQGTNSGTNQMLTNLQLMKFAVPLVYKNSGFSLAVSPILQYGSLAISYNNGASITAPQIQQDGTVAYNNMPVNTGTGVSQDFGFGYNIGLAYEMNGFTIGAVYTSAIDMKYDHQISVATKQFGLKRGQGLSDNLEQPAEYGVGASYAFGEHTLAVDYKNIAWSSAKGYKDFKWEDQNIVIVGYQYETKKWALRLGYNYASNPIKEQTAANMQTDYDGAVINYFNAAGFPATVESHYAIGGSYQISDKVGVDFAYTYAPEVTESYDTSALSQYQVYAGAYAAGLQQGATPAQAAQGAQNAAQNTSSTATVKHSQSAVSVAMTIKF